ncbi:MAG: alpha-L-fucosidase [Sphingomonadales bacterium]|nr:alpha-L-fucosidase [Sphingomonadales bacterium]
MGSGVLRRLPFLALTCALAFPGCAHAQWTIQAGEPRQSKVSFLVEELSKKDWDANSYADPKDVEKWQDLRYGLMISFGVTVKGNAELSWGTIGASERKAPDGNALSDGKSLPMAEWTRWDRDMKLEKFNAREWVAWAKAAGFKYIVPVIKHHDGFHQWNTAYSDYKITNTPFGRDLLKELADACKEAGMPLGIYYSQRDWHHPDYAPTGFGPNKDQPGPDHQKYIDYQFNVVRELLTKYGKISVFWWDAAWWGGMFKEQNWDAKRMTKMVRELQPGIVINNRNSVPGDFDTPEQRMGVFQTNRAWESTVSYEDTWSYTGVGAKTREQVLNLLVKTAINNGNLILSLGPEWAGNFNADEMATTVKVGDWLRAYGKAIYDTRGGPWKPGRWGGSTWRGSTAYLHVLDPKAGEIALRSISGNRVRAANVLLANGKGGVVSKPVSFSETGGVLKINVPANLHDAADTVVQLDLAKPLPKGIGLDPLPGTGAEEYSQSLHKPFDYELVYGKRTDAVAGLTSSGLSQPLRDGDLTRLIQDGGAAGFAVTTAKGDKPWVELDLGKTTFVTGVYLDADAGGQPIAISVSSDGQTYKPVWQAGDKQPKGPWEVEVNDFIAGAITPGHAARYVRVSVSGGASSALVVRQLGTWSKAAK